MALRLFIIASITAALGTGAYAQCAPPTGNLGYNSYEGFLSKGSGLEKRFGPGVGYPSQIGGDYFYRYLNPRDWGPLGYGTGHLGDGYGPMIFPRREGPSPPGMFDPLPGPLQDAPPPKIKIARGTIRVAMPGNIPGIKSVTVTMVAFNNADLAEQTLCAPPYVFTFPVMDGVKNVRVRIDYEGCGLAATSYPL